MEWLGIKREKTPLKVYDIRYNYSSDLNTLPAPLLKDWSWVELVNQGKNSDIHLYSNADDPDLDASHIGKEQRNSSNPQFPARNPIMMQRTCSKSSIIMIDLRTKSPSLPDLGVHLRDLPIDQNIFNQMLELDTKSEPICVSELFDRRKDRVDVSSEPISPEEYADRQIDDNQVDDSSSQVLETQDSLKSDTNIIQSSMEEPCFKLIDEQDSLANEKPKNDEQVHLVMQTLESFCNSTNELENKNIETSPSLFLSCDSKLDRAESEIFSILDANTSYDDQGYSTDGEVLEFEAKCENTDPKIIPATTKDDSENESKSPPKPFYAVPGYWPLNWHVKNHIIEGRINAHFNGDDDDW